jgi:hypothetical protein
MFRVDASQLTVMDDIVRGAANFFRKKSPIINKKELKKFSKLKNLDPEHNRAMYLRIPPPTD